MTPSQVFGLWVDINNSRLAAGGLTSDDERWTGELSASTPEPFDGKQPRDVLDDLVDLAHRRLVRYGDIPVLTGA